MIPGAKGGLVLTDPEILRETPAKPGSKERARFVAVYCRTLDPEAAAVMAFGCPPGPEAHRRGIMLLAEPKVRRACDRRLARDGSPIDLTPERVAERIVHTYDRAQVSGDLTASLGATSQMGKILGMFKDRSESVTVTATLGDLVARAEALEGKGRSGK